MLEGLGNALKGTMEKIAKAVFVDDSLLNELVRDIQRSLLQGDVNVKLVFELSNRIKERFKKEETPAGLTKKEHLIHILYEELVSLVGGENEPIKIGKKPFFIMLVGLFGSGKTTTAGKLASWYSKRGFKVALLGLDVYRAAAMDQLEQIASKSLCPVFTDKKEKDSLRIWKEFSRELEKFDVVIIDTAGRDALSKELIDELRRLNKEIKPDERLLVISADIGQAAMEQAKSFREAADITGVIITKMEGTAKGGGALSACSATGAKIKFIGVGEKIDDLEEFKAKNFISRLLGMGDIEALVEKAKDAMSEEKAEDLSKKFLKGDFTLVDLYEQMEALRKMGPLTKVMEMIPGMGSLKMPKELLKVQEDKLKNWRFIMDSFTKEELENPDIMSSGRIERAAHGSGRSTAEVKELLKHYRQSKKIMKSLKPGKDINKVLSRMGNLKMR